MKLVIGLALILAGCAAKTDTIVLTMPPGSSIQHANIERSLDGDYTIHDTAFNGAQMAIPQIR